MFSTGFNNFKAVVDDDVGFAFLVSVGSTTPSGSTFGCVMLIVIIVVHPEVHVILRGDDEISYGRKVYLINIFN